MSGLVLVFGSVALLLHGTQLTAESLQRVAGDRLRWLLTSLARNRVSALLSGTLITGVIQSSSAMAMLAIGFVSAGFLTVGQAIGLILGADIGTTLSAQLLAFRVTDYALLPVTLGFGLMFFGRRGTLKAIGRSVLGFGLMLFSLGTILHGSALLESHALFRSVLASLTQTPVMGFLSAVVVTAVAHSSAATVGLTVAFASQGLLGLDAETRLPLRSTEPVIRLISADVARPHGADTRGQRRQLLARLRGHAGCRVGSQAGGPGAPREQARGGGAGVRLSSSVHAAHRGHRHRCRPGWPTPTPSIPWGWRSPCSPSCRSPSA